MKGIYATRTVIVEVDNENSIYDPVKYVLCSMCHEIVEREKLKKGKHILFKDDILCCDECYNGPMIEREEGR